MSNQQESIPKKPSKKRWIIISAIAVVIIVVAGIFYATNRSVAAPLPPTGPNVTIWDSGFCSNTGNCGYSPVAKNVTLGTGLTWTNTGGQPHTATACTSSDPAAACPNGSGSNNSGLRNFDSASLGKGGQYTFTFNTSGTFYYYCTIHPWMHGTIVVQGA